MDSHVESTWDYGNSPVSPTPYRHPHNFSSESIWSVSSYSTSNPSFSRHNSLKKPPKQRLTKLIKHSLKYTLKRNKADSNHDEYWNNFHKKLKRIIRAFHDPLSLYDALNDPYCGKSSNKTCCSLIHILCKQFYLYSRSNNWSICFKIWDCIHLLLENGANTAIFYMKLNEAPQKNYNSIHSLYQALNIMLSTDVITNEQFANYISRIISAGNEDYHSTLIATFNHKTMHSSLSSIDSCTSISSLPDLSTTASCTTLQETEFKPSVLTLCIYKREDEDEWQNITYWMGDCLYHDYYVHLISPYVAKTFIMMGYDLLSVVLEKRDHLDYNNKYLLDTLIYDNVEIVNVFDRYWIHRKVIAFLWFIRYGNFMNDLVNIVDIGIKQLALDVFAVDTKIIEEILSYSHGFIVSNTKQRSNDNRMSKLELMYFDEDKWMMTAFEVLFNLDNYWIEYIAQYVMPQLTKTEIETIKTNLSEQTSDKEWNKFIRRISLKSINAFCKHDIFGVIDTKKMQYIITKNYDKDELIPILINAKYDIKQTFGSDCILYKILNDDCMDTTQINTILDAIYIGVNGDDDRDNKYASKLIINDLLFGVIDWKTNHSIWRNIALVFVQKYQYFCQALNDWFYELTTEQHHAKLIFFMENDMIDFNYCLNEELIESGFHALRIERAFNKKAWCVQMLGDWIYTNYQNEKDDIRRKEIAEKAIFAIRASSNNLIVDMNMNQDNVIIEQYLDQLKNDLSRW